jgi:hypothetical protein
MSLKGLLGGLVGGAIGAVIWAVVAYNLHFESSWVAWLVGLLVGAGYRIGSGGMADSADGVLAAVVALLAIAAGKYATVSMIVEDDLAEFGRLENEAPVVALAYELTYEQARSGKVIKWPRHSEAWGMELKSYPTDIQREAKAWWASLPADQQQELTDYPIFANFDYVTAQLAAEIAWEWEMDGEELEWPTGAIDPEWGPPHAEDFPDDVWAEAEHQWNRMSRDRQDAYIEEIKADYRARRAAQSEQIEQIAEEVKKEGFIATFGFFDMMFALFAVISAYVITSGNS